MSVMGHFSKLSCWTSAEHAGARTNGCAAHTIALATFDACRRDDGLNDSMVAIDQLSEVLISKFLRRVCPISLCPQNRKTRWLQKARQSGFGVRNFSKIFPVRSVTCVAAHVVRGASRCTWSTFSELAY
jgi:hypothetical protein